MTVSRSVLVRLRAEMAQFKKDWNDGTGAVKQTRDAMRDAEKQSKKTGKSISELDSVVARTSARLKGHRQEWDQVGSTVLRTGAVIAGAGVLMGKAAMDWETAWTGVLKTVDGTPEQLAAVEAGIRGLAKSMPESHKNIAATAEAAGQLGVATDDVVDFTRVMVMLGDTTNLTADEAATSMAQLMNVMQTAPDDVDRLGATLVDLGNKGASTERDIIQMAQRIAGAGEIVGMSEANVLALANALASSGIEVEAGGSAISNVLIDISKAVDSGSSKLNTFAQVAGTSADGFAQKWKADPATALADFTEGLGRMASNGENVFSTLESLGQSDVRVTRALLNMANAGDLLRESLANGDAAWESNIALVEEAEKRYDTTAARAEIAWNNIKDNAIDAGQGILPIVSALSDVVTALGSAFGALPDPIQGSIGVLALFTGGTLLAVGGVMKAVGAVADFRDSLGALEISAARSERTMGRLGKAAGVAAAIFATLQIADEFVPEAKLKSTGKFTEAILKLGSDATTAKEEINQLFTKEAGWGPLTTGIDGLQDSIEMMERSGLTKSLETIQSFGVLDTAGGLAADGFNKYDQALTSLVQSGALDEAALGAKLLSDEGAKISELLPEYSEALQNLKNDQSLANDSTKELTDSSSALDRRLAELGGDENAAKLLQQLTDASVDAAMGFLDLSNNIDPAKASLEEWIADLEKQAKAMDEWSSNMIKATARGIDQGVIDKFEEMGPEGAKRLAELVDGSQKEIDRLNAVWGNATEDAYRYADAIQGIPDSALTEFKTPGAKDAIATAQEVAIKYNLAPDQVRTILEALDYASEDIDKVMEGLGWVDGRTVTAKVKAETEQAREALKAIKTLLDSINPFKNITVTTTNKTVYDHGQQKADGGPITGVGGPKQDNILVQASVGEHMWTAREVENVGGHGAMYAMRAQARAGRRPRYAVGGAIDDAWNESFRTAAAAYGAPVPSISGANSGSSTPSVLTQSLEGMEIEIDINRSIGRVIRGEIRAAIQGENRFQAADRRAGAN